MRCANSRARNTEARRRRSRPGGEGSPIPRFADLLTVYRIAAAPLAAWLAVEGHRDAFFILIIVSFVTDIVDGPIARWSGQVSERGARLDTWADACTLLAGMLGVYVFEGNALQPDLPWLGLFLFSYGAAAIACLAKFGELPAYHLYLSKAAAFCSGAFVIWLYLVGYSRAFFLATLCLGVLANIESLLATRRLKRFRADVGSAFLQGTKEQDCDG